MVKSPKLGTYISENRDFKIKINRADENSSKLEIDYETSYSPEGKFVEKGQSGHFYSVQSGKAPFAMNIEVLNRPKGLSYCILDSWTGAYQEDNTLWMEGSRSFVNNKKGEVQALSLGTLKFSPS